MKISTTSMSALCLTVSLIKAEIRQYSYVLAVNNVTTNYSDPSYTPAPPASAGSLLTGTITLDDSIADLDPSLSLGSYGSTGFGSGPKNSFSFLNTTWDGDANRNQQGMGWVVSNDTTAPNYPGNANKLFTQEFEGDTLNLLSSSSFSGIGGTGQTQRLQVVFNDPSGSWFSSDALPATMPDLSGPSTGSLRFYFSETTRIAGGAFANYNYTLDGHFVSFTPIPEPSAALLLVGAAAVGLRRRRVA